MEQFVRLRYAEFVSVADVNPEAADRQVDRCLQPRVSGFVRVPVHGMDRSDKGEFVEDFVTADVASVEDEVDSAKGVMDFRTQKPMSVRNQTEPMDGGRGTWDVGGT
jgi:hypothetical protein